MNNNDLLRRIRYAFELDDASAVAMFSLNPVSSVSMNPQQYRSRLLREDDAGVELCSDRELTAFLDGLIVHRRGPAPAKQPSRAPASRLSKNDVLKKLRIALAFREQDMLDTLASGGSELSAAELGALFRKPGHKNYRTCGDQVMRAFLRGLTRRLRGDSDSGD